MTSTKDLSKLSLEEQTRQELSSRLALLKDEKAYKKKELLDIENEIGKIEKYLNEGETDMSDVEFTSGPWVKNDKRPHCNGFSIFSNEGYVCFVGDSDSSNNTQANASLIETAPELYEELKYIVDEAFEYSSRTGSPPPTWAGRASLKLAKARGDVK